MIVHTTQSDSKNAYGFYQIGSRLSNESLVALARKFPELATGKRKRAK